MSRYPTFRSILVPLDGSPLAEDAIPYALAIAERARSKVRFVLVYPHQYPPLLIEPANVYLKELTRRFRERLGRSLSSLILNGPVAPSLVKHAQEIGADLVVMTTHGRSGLRRTWLGSVTDQVMRTIKVPLMVVRPREDGSLPAVTVSEIVVPLDGSPLAETALEPAAAMARIWDAEVSLVQVIHPALVASDPALPFPTGYDDEMTAIHRESAQDYVQDRAEGLRERGVKASGVAVVGHAGVADTLLDLASPERVSLVAMATHGRGGVRRFVLGSITDKVIRAAQVPILVMPPVRTPRRARSVQRQKSQAISPGMDFVYA
jgi:nucleotide-binding universal stress UspA family protein